MIDNRTEAVVLNEHRNKTKIYRVPDVKDLPSDRTDYNPDFGNECCISPALNSVNFLQCDYFLFPRDYEFLL